MVACEGHVEALAKSGEHTDGLQTSHGHKDAEEEQNGRHVDARQHVSDALLHGSLLLFFLQAGIEHFSNGPKHAEHQQDANERRQMGDALEDRNEDQTAHTQEEDGLALLRGERAGLEAVGLFLGEGKFAFQR